jgi:TolB-like protein
MPADSRKQAEPLAVPAVPWWRRLWQRLHSRFARQIALAAVVIGAIAAAGHFVGGMIGWWHAYELTFGSHDGSRSTAAPPRAKEAPPLSIVVLPFANTGAAEDAWFAENLTSDIAVELSRVPDGSVIGREAAAKYRGREADPREVAQELGVRYVLAGSVERAGDKVRLRVQLLDGETGTQRWAERFDVERAALPALVDDLARKLARAVDIEMVRSAGSAAARLAPNAVRAEDLAMQGWAALYRGLNRKTNEEALALFERAVAMDAGSVRGWGGIAYASSNARRWARSEQDLTRLETAAAQLERLDPGGYYGALAPGLVSFQRRDWQAALAAGDRMIERFPGHHGGYQLRGPVLVRLGRFEDALADTEKAIALLPNNPDTSNEWRRGFIYFGMGRYADAASALRQVLAKNPTGLGIVFPLAAALARDGRSEEARQVLNEARRHYPDLSTAKVAELQFEGPGERFIAAREDMLAALRELGLP